MHLIDEINLSCVNQMILLLGYLTLSPIPNDPWSFSFFFTLRNWQKKGLKWHFLLKLRGVIWNNRKQAGLFSAFTIFSLQNLSGSPPLEKLLLNPRQLRRRRLKERHKEEKHEDRRGTINNQESENCHSYSH